MALAEHILSVGIKGQSVILAELNKIKKVADDVFNFKKTGDVGRAGLAKITGGGVGSPSPLPTPTTPTPTTPTPEQKKSDKKQDENNSKFAKATNKLGSGAQKLSEGAANMATLNPVGAIQKVVGAAAKATSWIPVFGSLAAGGGALASAMVGIAHGALESAKGSTSRQYGLESRNATTSYYGGNGIDPAGMSRSEKANLTMQVAGAFGKIQKPMLDALNSLTGSKDTAALGRVAGGNWASTGTTKGWMLQQMADQMGGLPPEIAQRFQASLLKRHGGELIQNKTGAEETAQYRNTAFENRAEDQNARMFKESRRESLDEKTGKMVNSMDKLDAAFNTLQINLLKGGGQLIGTVSAMTTGLNAAIAKMSGVKNNK